MKDVPADMRPREEFKRLGAKGVSDEILLAILLRTGTIGRNVLDVAREILLRAGGLKNLAHSSFAELNGIAEKVKGLGEVKRLELAAAIELGARIADTLREKMHELPAMRCPEDFYQVMYPLAGELRQECFWVVLLNVKNRLIGQPIVVSQGSLDSTRVHPREVFSHALRCSAYAVVFVHNHPSGDPTPSRQDILLTERLVSCARMLGLRVLDHLVVGKPSSLSPGYVSLREKGMVEFE